MMNNNAWMNEIAATIVAGILSLPAVEVFAEKGESQAELTAHGQELAADYAAMLEALEQQIVAELPVIDVDMKTAFLNARDQLAGVKDPGEDAAPEAIKAYQAQQALAETAALDTARVLLVDLKPFLASEALDNKLMKVAILRHGTPVGLAEFAQQSEPHKALIDNLFADEALMKQVLIAGGANGGEYGEAMQVYTAILEASVKARERGSIFQRLALGTALQQPWMQGNEKGGVYGIIHADHDNPDGQVARYLHYEKAFLDGELDPAFKDMNTWECRFITNDPYSNEELAWTRAMLRTYRPDHITTEDHKWRYTRFVKSDVPYQSPEYDDAFGSKTQQIVACGGKCGPRAFYGRTLTRAFGIPSRRSTQTGHAAMSRWTPDGWAICFGAWWSIAWCGPQGGLDFLLDSQAREFEDDYMQVLRAQWIGDALGESDVNIGPGRYGQGGGFWDGLAHFKKRAVVADAKVQAVAMAGGMKLGESDELLGDEKGDEIEITEAQRKIVIDENGMITIPAVACASPENSTEKVAFMKSWDGGTQVHYQRLGNRPEILRYNIEVPKAGKYEISATVATVATEQQAIFRVNRREVVNADLPYTKGLWEQSQPQTIELREGTNSIMLTFRAPNRGVTLRQFQLKPVKDAE